MNGYILYDDESLKWKHIWFYWTKQNTKSGYGKPTEIVCIITKKKN